jgi:hypothetical protein
MMKAEFRIVTAENLFDDRVTKVELEALSSQRLSMLHRLRAGRSSLSEPATKTREDRSIEMRESQSETT